MGKFFSLARKHGYYEDTVFVVIADHNVRVRTAVNGVMPLDNYRIFGLILGGGIEPQIYKKTCTQVDVMATAVDLLGADLVHPIIGRTIFSPAKESFALMKFYSLYGFMHGNKLAVLEPDAKARTYQIDGPDLLPLPADRELERDALALLTISSYLYRERRHTLPEYLAVRKKRF